jgi:FkbM family methyltransferase
MRRSGHIIAVNKNKRSSIGGSIGYGISNNNDRSSQNRGSGILFPFLLGSLMAVGAGQGLFVLFKLVLSNTTFTTNNSDNYNNINNNNQAKHANYDDMDLCNLIQVSELNDKNKKSDEKCCVLANTSKLLKPFEMSVHCDNSIVSQTILTDGDWETGITSRITHVLEHLLDTQQQGQDQNNGFLDVGGNVGYFSFLAASLGYSVLTFEPMSYNTRLIRRSQFINSHLDVTLLDRALVSEDMFSKLGIKSVCFDMPKGNADNGVVKLNGDQSNHYSKNDCKTYAQTTTIDRGMEGMKAVPKAMKMDIEGFEGHALAGATRLLKEIKPCYIWFEYQLQAILGDPAQILDILSDANYEIKDIDPKQTQIFKRNTNSGRWDIPNAFFGEARHMECSKI